jgi:DNA polymerase III alpha subunit
MDIDLDVKTTFNPTQVFDHIVKASIYKAEKLTPHPCGVYFQDIAQDPFTKLSAVPYELAEALGYFKIDFLHLRVYDFFSSREEIKELIKHDPDWSLLTIPSVVKSLFQLSKHADLLAQVKPRSILELADCLALIRPQKRYILKNYLTNPEKYRHELYKSEPGSDGYGFKKAHACAYSLVIVLQLHLIKAGIKIE